MCNKKFGTNNRLSVVSCRAEDELDESLQLAADRLHLTKSQLVHDIAVRFVKQTGLSGLRLATPKLDRAQRTRDLVVELHNLWGDEPEYPCAVASQRRLA